jgi:hypothetical protein
MSEWIWVIKRLNRPSIPTTLPPHSAKEPVRFHAHMTIILFIFDLLDAILMAMSRCVPLSPTGSSSWFDWIRHRSIDMIDRSIHD